MAVKFTGSFRSYTFIDSITQGYNVLIALGILCLHGSAVPKWPDFVMAHVLLFLLIHCLIRLQVIFPRQAALDFVRHFYPVLLYTFFYRETGELNHMIFSGYLDPFFIHLEQRIFGLQPSLMLMGKLPFLPVSELFYAAYFSYYVMIFGIGLALFLRGRAQFFHYISVLSFVFYVCCIIYIFTPVVGPRIFYPELCGYHLSPEFLPASVPAFPDAIKPGPFYQLMDWIYSHLEAPGASFPSSHVAIGLCTAYFSFRYLPRIRYLHLVAVILLSVATVYCRYHYAVDVFGGLMTFLLLVPLGNKLFFRFSHAGLDANLGIVEQPKTDFRATRKRANKED
jgi:membrane-associated phospholipid phosphatase